MDIERKNLEILFLKIPYYKIAGQYSEARIKHSYSYVDEELYMQYARSVFPNNSEDEQRNIYQKMRQDLKNNLEDLPNVFRLIMNAARKMLVYDGKEIMCRFDEMLRWREISFQLGQDFFTCAFLASHDLERGYQSENFSWLPIIRSDDNRLHNILKRGMAENHFHLAGSTKVIELNWVCLMNLIDGRIHDFEKLPSALQIHHTDRVRSEGKKESFYAECQRAAFYRVYLFAILKENHMLIEQAEEIMKKLDRGRPIEGLVSEIQDLIIIVKYIYGARIDEKCILDYAFEKSMRDSNDRECFLLAGERRFLYECYKSAVSKGFTDRQKNLFYSYLSIRTHFRGELIQINRQTGFANFSNYQDRKEIFIEGQIEYEDELIRLALNETMRKQNIVSLEARICPKKSAVKLYEAIARNEKIIEEQKNRYGADKSRDPVLNKKHFRSVGDSIGFQNEMKKDKVIYVLHFPKIRDEEFCHGTPRNQNVRTATLKQTRSIVALLEKETWVNGKIRGIDACSNELYCRPEVFAQAFRYLLDMEFAYRKEMYFRMDGKDYKGKLRATYHAGEDFLDIADGLRAIDEAVLFCGLKRGSRIGHGLALGISSYEYYKYKGYKLVIPKQVLLDDIAWMLQKAGETGCTIESRLKEELLERYYSLYEEIYRGNVQNLEKASVKDYYQSWKLRGDSPDIYRLDEADFFKRMEKTAIWKFDRYERNDSVSDSIRKIGCYRNLYFAYHYNEKVRKTGNEQTEFKADERYAEFICQLQDKMIRKLVWEGIGIETNPSSNYLIGTIQKYEEHPVLRFNARKLKHTEPNGCLNVSINTDDQGVFDTMLENEYALMALALKKAKDKKNQPLYDVEDIYEWIDYVRKMGMEQVFE